MSTKRSHKKVNTRALALGRVLTSIILVVLIAITVIAIQNKESLLSMFAEDAIKSEATNGTVNPEIAMICSSAKHTLVLKADGTVWAWGENSYGQLGQGNTDTISTIVQVKDKAGSGYLSNIVHIGVGEYASYAVSRTGYVYAWGYNYSSYGELGIGSASSIKQSLPTEMKTSYYDYVTGATKVCGSNRSVYILKADKTVWAAGANTSGKLGINSTTKSVYAVQMNSAYGIIDIAATNDSFVALTEGGKVYTCGENGNGQLGIGSTTDQKVIKEVTSISNIKKISAGYGHVMALTGDSKVYIWGVNGNRTIRKWNNY